MFLCHALNTNVKMGKSAKMATLIACVAMCAGQAVAQTGVRSQSAPFMLDVLSGPQAQALDSSLASSFASDVVSPSLLGMIGPDLGDSSGPELQMHLLFEDAAPKDFLGSTPGLGTEGITTSMSNAGVNAGRPVLKVDEDMKIVPLPAAAYAGMALLVGLGGIRLVRRSSSSR